MRDIKFRAWNGNKMRHKVNISDGKCVRYGYQWFNEGNDVYESEPMQFTGLKDKNGVEIYEGDIYKTVEGIDWDCDAEEYNGYIEHTHIVEYKEGVCSIGFNLLTHQSNIKVIGNIHENKDLLK